ncbi:S8 family serine peptidase [Thalassotalea psychrophila]|uniref:S8 family serine peptidase n=1 Tax=Thalassotalea psychrophila TaxID=3065647 RepID=A0ABY9TYB0_9GAMM|nr:S8 family serine peptidase [Colwelliaceae bacterium SQ149]
MKNVITKMTLLAASIAVSAITWAESNNDGPKLPFATSTHAERQTTDIASISRTKQSLTNEYFVILKQPPLALYDGGIDGLAPTSRLGSKHSNTTAKGLLNTKSLASKRYRKHLANKQLEAQNHIESRLKRKVTINRRYDTVLNGFVAELSDNETRLLQQHDAIKFIEKVGFDQIDTDSGPSYSGADKVWSGTAEHGTAGNMGEGIVVGILDSGIASFLEPVDDIFDTENLPPFHPSFTDIGGDGFDHTNPKGKGVYIGDCAYTPATENEPERVAEPNWCNDKLIGIVPIGVYAKDIINGDNNESRNRTGQDINGHGTHTASTAAGNVVKNVKTESQLGKGLRHLYQEDFTYEQISGVAPHANIIAYQVCSPLGSCNQSYALEAIERAADDGVDVINYSISGVATSPWYHAQALGFLAARKAGLNISASAGNSGAEGASSIRTPGNAPWVTGVGANSHNRGFNDKVLTLVGGPADFAETEYIGKGATSALPATEVVFASDVEFTGEGTHSHTHIHSILDEEKYYHESDDAHSYPASTLDNPVAYEHTHVHNNMDAYDVYGIQGACGEDSISAEAVAGKVVICNRGGRDTEGTLSRLIKGYAMHQLGASGLILINTLDSSETLNNDHHTLPAIHLNRKDGRKLLAWLDQGADHKVAINASNLVADDEIAGVMGGFSAQGPDSFSLDYLIPAISAPGVGILAAGIGKGMKDYRISKAAQSDIDFLYMDGTSMSTPHVTGMYALLKAAQPEWTPAQAQSALMLTAASGLKVIDDYVDGEYIYKDANFHLTGSGLARVDRAVASGLILTETFDGYMAADPFGDVPGMAIVDTDGTTPADPNLREEKTRVPAAGWHGKPERMNLASLSKGACDYQCSWTRTFTATKDATWNVSFSYLTEGMELTTNIEQISVRAGEDFTLDVSANLVGELKSVWSFGRVHLTATDSDIPVASLPVAVEFVAGSTPKDVNISAHRDVGTVVVEDVITVGTEDLTFTKSGLFKSEVFVGEVQRAANPTNLYLDYTKNDGLGFHVIPLAIPALAGRLVVEVLETSSPDLDIYIGVDPDGDGQMHPNEMTDIRFWSIKPGANEFLDYEQPRIGQYWILVHNFGDRFNDFQDDAFDPANLIIDDFKLAVSVITEDNDSLTVTAPKEVSREAEVAMKINWELDMDEGDKAYGIIKVSTAEAILDNVGTINVNLTRASDDVQLSLASNETEQTLAGFNIRFAENNTGQDRQYQMSVDLVAGSSVELLAFNASNNGQATNADLQDVEFSQQGDTLTWSYNHPSGSAAKTALLMVNYADVQGYIDLTPTVYSVLDNADKGEISGIAEPVMVYARPVFVLAATEQLVDPGSTVTIVASVEDAVIDNAQIRYQWSQLQGPKVAFSKDQNSITFTVPDNADGKHFEFSLIGSNGVLESKITTINISVTGEDVNAGSSSLSMLFFTIIACCSRRKLMPIAKNNNQ